jgi:GT2 family glycosyltransferase
MSITEGFAVVVLNYNKKKALLECLESIYASIYPQLRIVIVDNNSSDGSADAVAQNFPDTPLVRNPVNSGVAAGRNRGWSFAQKHFDFEYIIFLDDDSEVSPEYFNMLARIYREKPDVGIVTGKSYLGWQSEIFCSVGISVNLYTGIIYDIGSGFKDSGQYDVSGYRDACGGFAFSARKDLFSKLNGFDEAFSPYGWEDVDFCLRARKAGYRTYYTADAIVVHKGTKAGRGPVPEYERHKIKNYLLLLKRHTSWPQKFSCCVCIPMKGLYIVFKMIKSGNAHVILSQFRGFFEGLFRKKTPKSLSDNGLSGGS